jgi:hypothetical protein
VTKTLSIGFLPPSFQNSVLNICIPGDERQTGTPHFFSGWRILPRVVRPASFSLREALSPATLAFGEVSVLVLGPSLDSGHFLGARALLARFKVLSLGVASSEPLFTLSCLWETVRMMPGALGTGVESVLMKRDEEATVFRAKLGIGGGTRGVLEAGRALASSPGLSGPWEAEQQTLFSSGFCLGIFLRGLALGFLRDPLCCRGCSFPRRELLLPRGSFSSSVTVATAPAPMGSLLGDVSEVPRTELRRANCVSVLLGVSRGGTREGGSSRFQPPVPLLDLEIGTTLRMLSFSEVVKVRTALGAVPWLRRTLPGLAATSDVSLKEFLLGAGTVASFPLVALSLRSPPLQLASPFLEAGDSSPVGLEAGLEETWLLPASPAPEDTEPPPSLSSSSSPSPGLESVPSEHSKVSEQSVVSEM